MGDPDGKDQHLVLGHNHLVLGHEYLVLVHEYLVLVHECLAFGDECGYGCRLHHFHEHFVFQNNHSVHFHQCPVHPANGCIDFLYGCFGLDCSMGHLLLVQWLLSDRFGVHCT